MFDDQVVLVEGPKKLRRLWLDQMVTGVPDGTTLVWLRTGDSLTLARFALGEMLRQVQSGTIGDTLLIFDDPVWLARTPLGMDRANKLATDLVHAAGDGGSLRIVAAMNPLILKHGDLAGAVMARATRVFHCQRSGTFEGPAAAPAGLAGVLNGFTGHRSPASVR